MSTGISLPGIINKNTLQVDFCPNIKCLRNVCVKDLIPSDIWERLQEQHIYVSFEHDTQAASIYEKEKLYKPTIKSEDYSSARNICCVYVAAGIGASIIIDNHLCRGTSNSLGEFGHTPAPALLVAQIPDAELSKQELYDKYSYDLDDNRIEKENAELNYLSELREAYNKKMKLRVPCECGEIACLENEFRRNVFGSDDITSYLDRINDTKCLNLFHECHPYRYRVLKEYIGFIVGLVINLLNPDLIIFCGRVIQDIDQLHHDFNTIRA